MAEPKPSKTMPAEAPPASEAPAGPPTGPPPSATPSKQPMASARASAAQLYGAASTAFKKGSLWGKVCMVIGAVEIIIGFLRVCVALWLLFGSRAGKAGGTVYNLMTAKEAINYFGSGKVPFATGLSPNPPDPTVKEPKIGYYDSGYEFYNPGYKPVTGSVTVPGLGTVTAPSPTLYNLTILQVILLLALFTQIAASAALIFAAVKRHFLICLIWIGFTVINTNLYIVTCAFVYMSIFAMVFNFLEVAAIIVVVLFIKDILANGSNKATVGSALMGLVTPQPQPSNKSMAQGV